jgi:hypothetical protein
MRVDDSFIFYLIKGKFGLDNVLSMTFIGKPL